jgi:L-rhamnose isomerase / sugar isomerase
VFNELAEAELNPRDGFHPAYMIDQSHNVTDPIESLISSAETIAGSYCRAQLVDRDALRAAQEDNDAMAAFQILRRAYLTDITPLLAMARADAGGAIDPLAAYRASGYRTNVAQKRRSAGTQAGIV